MRSTLFTVAALLIGFALLQAGNGLQGTALVVRAGLEAFSPLEAGLITTGFFAGMVAGSQLAPRLIAAAGHVRAFAALASAASAAALAHLLLVEPVAWIALRTLTGFCFAGLIMAVESWLNASTDASRRGQLLSVYAMVGLGAGACGQLMMSLQDAAGPQLFIGASMILSVALIPVALSRAQAPAPSTRRDPPRIGALWRTSPFGCVAALLVGMALGLFFGLTPLFLAALDFSQTEVGVIMAAGAIGALALQYPLGALSDRISRRLVVVGVAGLAALFCLAVSRMDAAPLGVSAALAFGAGGLLLPAQSIVAAHVNDRTPPDEMVAAAGALVMMSGTGAALGPVLGGVAMDAVGPVGLLYALAAIQAAVALWGLFRMTVRDSPDGDAKGAHAPSMLQPVDGALEGPQEDEQYALAL